MVKVNFVLISVNLIKKSYSNFCIFHEFFYVFAGFLAAFRLSRWVLDIRKIYPWQYLDFLLDLLFLFLSALCGNFTTSVKEIPVILEKIRLKIRKNTVSPDVAPTSVRVLLEAVLPFSHRGLFKRLAGEEDDIHRVWNIYI